MKSLTLLALILPAGFVLAESSIPEPYPKERYTDTLSQSPFVLATPPPDDKPDKNSPLDNIVLTGMGKTDDGRDYVIAQRIGDEGSMKFIGNEPNEQGISVKEVKWADKWSQSNVILKLGSEQKLVEFKKEAPPMIAPPPGANAGRQPGMVNAPQPPNANATTANMAPRPSTGGGPRSNSITPTIPRPGGGGPQVPRPGGVPLPSGGNNFRGGAQLTQGGAQPAAQPSPNDRSGRMRVRSVPQINNR